MQCLKPTGLGKWHRLALGTKKGKQSGAGKEEGDLQICVFH